MRNKFRATPRIVDGIRFHSKGEANRYWELKMLRAAGEITGLHLQFKYPLLVVPMHGKISASRAVEIGVYTADFVYTEKGSLIVEDFKGGYRDDTYKLRKKLFEAIYGIEIRETGGKAIKQREAKRAAA